MSYDGTMTVSDPNLVATFTHEDESKTYIVLDIDGSHSNPRDFDGNVATLIQRSRDHVDLDDDDAGLDEARERFSLYDERSADNWSSFMQKAVKRAIVIPYDREGMVRRYIAMFRPDILLYVDYWVAQSYTQDASYGWGYVTREAWEEAMGADYDGDVTPQEAFDQEVDVFSQWARGDVFGYIHVEPDGTEDSCWGFLGYDKLEDIVEQATDSPITSREDA